MIEGRWFFLKGKDEFITLNTRYSSSRFDKYKWKEKKKSNEAN